jgi:hypothetical protein
VSRGILLLLTGAPLGLLTLILLANYSASTAFGQVSMSTPSVKVVYPTTGQQINPNNNTLTFTGTSSDNSTSNCEVSIILNNIKPYQPTLPIKEKDYSSWTFDLSPSYTPIKEGQNKVTAKISCIASPVNNTKWYSVEFAGKFENRTKSNTTSTSEVNQQEFNLNDNINNAQIIPLNKTNETMTNNNINNAQIIPLNKTNETMTNNNISNAQIIPLNKTNETRENVSSELSSSIAELTPKQLSIAIKLGKNPISKGTLQTVNVSVSDSKSGLPVADARVEATITAPSGKSIKFEHTTLSTGETSFSWKVPRVAETGLAHIKFQVSATGYESNQTMAAYEVDKNTSTKSLNPFT